MKMLNWYRLLVTAIVLIVSQSAGAVSVNWGTLATSSINNCVLLTCTVIDSEEQGAAGMNASASTDIIEPGMWESSATSSLNDTAGTFTPTLGVKSVGLAANTLVESSASGIQGYTNLGGDRTITIDLALDIDAITNFGLVSAFAVVFMTDELELTGDSFDDAILGQGFETAAGSALLSKTAFDLNPLQQVTSFGFDVLDGEDFLIWAGLFALAGPGDTADASNTLGMTLRVGNDPIDVSTLDVASQRTSVIPLPAGVWLFLTGIVFVAGFIFRFPRHS